MATQAYGQLGRGLGTAIGNFFGGNPQARQAGELAGLQAALMEQQIGGNRVQQQLNQAKLDEAERQRQANEPDAAVGRILTGMGLPATHIAPVREFQATGKVGGWDPSMPADAPLGAPRLPHGLDLTKLTEIGRRFYAEQAVQSGGAKTIKDAFEALLMEPRVGLTAGVADGRITPQVGGARFAALDGKPLVSSHEYGVTDNFTGETNSSGPVAQRFGQYRDATTGAQRANAVQSYAAAGNSNASAAKTRAEMAEGPQSPGRIPVGYRPVTMADGKPGLEPIPGGPADNSSKGAKLPAEVQRMNIALRSLDEGLNRYEEVLGKFNPRSVGDQTDPKHRAEIESLVADLRMQLKEAQALGALTGPDVAMLDQALASPTSMRGAAYGREGLGTQLTEVRSSLQRRKNALAAEYNRPELAGSGGAATKTPTPGAPAVGTVQDGFRFKGGNPADANAWERVR